jgi:hypothetical protein
MKALINYANEAYIAHHTGQPGPDIGHGVGLAVGLAAMQTVHECLSTPLLLPEYDGWSNGQIRSYKV